MPSVDYPIDPGTEWSNEDGLENFVRYSLVRNPGIFTNLFGEPIPRMVATIPGQDEDGHGIDVIAIDANDKERYDPKNPRRRLWLIEVSRGTPQRSKKGVPLRNSVLMKELPEREYANYKPQMSPEWRFAAAQNFLKRPDSTDKLAALFDVSGPAKPDGTRKSGLTPEQLKNLFWKYYFGDNWEYYLEEKRALKPAVASVRAEPAQARIVASLSDTGNAEPHLKVVTEPHRKAVIVPVGTIVIATETKASRQHYSQPGQKPRTKIDTDIDVGTEIYTYKPNRAWG
jgi:hypothetical protein